MFPCVQLPIRCHQFQHQFFLPCALMIAIYTKLYVSAQKHVRCMLEQFKSVNCMIIPVNAGNSDWVRRRTREAVNDHKARITIGVIMGIFLCCWLPFFVVNVVRANCLDCVSKRLFIALTWLGYANSCANPIIYGILSRDFRKAFHRILTCERGRRKQAQTLLAFEGDAGYSRRHSRSSEASTACLQPHFITINNSSPKFNNSGPSPKFNNSGPKFNNPPSPSPSPKFNNSGPKFNNPPSPSPSRKFSNSGPKFNNPPSPSTSPNFKNPSPSPKFNNTGPNFNNTGPSPKFPAASPKIFHQNQF